ARSGRSGSPARAGGGSVGRACGRPGGNAGRRTRRDAATRSKRNPPPLAVRCLPALPSPAGIWDDPPGGRARGAGGPAGRGREDQSRAHVRGDGKAHVVILAKSRRTASYGGMRRAIGPILRDLCRPKEIGRVEGKAMPDRAPLPLSVPPRDRLAMASGYLKG